MAGRQRGAHVLHREGSVEVAEDRQGERSREAVDRAVVGSELERAGRRRRAQQRLEAGDRGGQRRSIGGDPRGRVLGVQTGHDAALGHRGLQLGGNHPSEQVGHTRAVHV